MARCLHATQEVRVQFPDSSHKAFSFVSNLNSRHQWKIHRYLYTKDICDVILQYLVDNGNESVGFLERKIIEENSTKKIQENFAYLIIPW